MKYALASRMANDCDVT